MNPACGVPLMSAVIWQAGTSRYSWPFYYLTAKRDMQLEKLQNNCYITAWAQGHCSRNSGDWVQANTRMEIFLVTDGWACVIPLRKTQNDIPLQGLRLKISDLNRHFYDFGITSS